MPALRPTALRRYQAVLSIQKMLAVRARLYRAELADPEALDVARLLAAEVENPALTAALSVAA